MDDPGVRQGVQHASSLAVGNPSPDLDGSIRPGDNLYTDCDRRHRRHHGQDQVVLPDGAARRLGPRRRLAAGRRRRVGGKKVVVHAGKTGWVYVLDAATGKLVRKSDELHAAGEHVRPADRRRAPGCCRAPTAARSGRRSRSIRRWGTPSSPALHQPMNYITHYGAVREGPALARLRLRGHPGRGAVRPLLRGRPQDRQDRLAEQGAAADDGRRAWPPPAASPSPVKATATSTPTTPRPASCSGSSTPAPAATPPR